MAREQPIAMKMAEAIELMAISGEAARLIPMGSRRFAVALLEMMVLNKSATQSAPATTPGPSGPSRRADQPRVQSGGPTPEAERDAAGDQPQHAPLHGRGIPCR
jgi:hypothetical protein